MIIVCPFCGPRDLSEFAYCGDADNLAARPDPAATDPAAWNAYVYDRTNPAGEHAEIWQHAGGCRKFLRVVRNTVTHEISGVTMLEPKA
ncbi:MAG: sarcosine oxidase subunit delta [Roseitalea sp.]|jgi:sarcosine oxidase subunit delta|nr:sarcosine oxidase subunit delta [Roseitalea sp.]MBO6721254.1 sarcosine oxidase subunit delta [Roseitalea sp.]MBO6742262.1 sarcosine oxidase subunit delta [Roseitalea sp.]